MEVDDEIRPLYTVTQNRSGQLILVVASGLYRIGFEGEAVKEHRITFHISNESKTTNTIHGTFTSQSGKSNYSYVVTDAVKRKSGFCLVFVRRALDLRNRAIAIVSDVEELVVGAYEPNNQTLCHALLVGPPDLEFPPVPLPLMMAQVKFEKFRLVHLHVLANVLPSDSTGDFVYNNTLNPEPLEGTFKSDAEVMMCGASPATMLDEVWLGFNELLAKFLELRLRQGCSNDNLSKKYLEERLAYHDRQVAYYCQRVRVGLCAWIVGVERFNTLASKRLFSQELRGEPFATFDPKSFRNVRGD